MQNPRKFAAALAPPRPDVPGRAEAPPAQPNRRTGDYAIFDAELSGMRRGCAPMPKKFSALSAVLRAPIAGT
ncbi:hypothetical protein [Blastochloris viridis]|uniref:Uncharacterized protein n=1 Tax=Blastochloris viridis TaxID=1079 RepID=A0A182D1T6_BLAVI|nr:hypothetical protein [Blastochloris viridis]BAR99318.1 hypothetical protein BV133_1725 [Blastochloris viridis]